MLMLSREAPFQWGILEHFYVLMFARFPICKSEVNPTSVNDRLFES